MPTYTMSDALEIAAQLEPIMAACGVHVAIGGSLVYRGHSEKDIDIFLYPHSRQTTMEPVKLVRILETAGYSARGKHDGTSTQVPDVWTATNAERKKIDFFFLSRVNRTPYK